MPKPKKNEEKDDFISRCISIVMTEGVEQKQAIAICNAYWDKRDKSKRKILTDDALNSM